VANLKGSPPVVRLERMHKHGQRCADLIEMTANALVGGAVALILLAIQKNNLELNINRAVKWAHSAFQTGNESTERVIKSCVLAFPSLWYPEYESRDKSPWDEEVLGFNENYEWYYESGELDDENDNSFFRQSSFKGFTNALVSKLSSFLANTGPSDDNPHHKLIVMILILEHTCLLFASQPKPAKDEALDRAYSRYCASTVHNELTNKFSAPPKEYSILQFTEFVLEHRL